MSLTHLLTPTNADWITDSSNCAPTYTCTYKIYYCS